MKKGLIIVAAILLAVGISLSAGALIAAGFDFSKFITDESETNTYTASADFQDIEIDTDISDITFKLSDDGGFRAVCLETGKLRHSVSVADGKLTVKALDERKWYDYIGIFRQSPSVTLYLPSNEYEAVAINNSTGNIAVPDGFSFGGIEVTTGTGNVSLGAGSDGFVKIRTSTGNIAAVGVRAGEMELSVSTGNIVGDNLACSGKLLIKVSTGDTLITGLSCGGFESEGSTGNIVLKDTSVAGELNIKRSTGNVRFENSDAAEITVKTSTGDVSGTLLSEKIFTAKTSTGKVRVPETASGGRCEITTSTGDINVRLSSDPPEPGSRIEHDTLSH